MLKCENCKLETQILINNKCYECFDRIYMNHSNKSQEILTPLNYDMDKINREYER